MRLFVAALFNSVAIEALAKSVRRSLPTDATERFRWVKPHKLHATVLFIGDSNRSEECAEIVYSAVAEIPAPVTLGVNSVQPFPFGHRPHVIAAILKSSGDELKTVRSLIADQLSQKMIHFDTRPLRPHVTFAYVKRSRRFVPSDQAALSSLQLPLHLTLERIVLMNSFSTPSGYQYSVIKKTPAEERRQPPQAQANTC